MKNFKKRSLALFIVFSMVFAGIPQAIFATDYNNHWAKNSIAKWSEKGLVVGYEDGTFKPSNAITRGELAAILVRVFEFKETASAKSYKDVVADKWYAESVAMISSAKLMNDSEDTFRPEAPATREEAAYAIAKAYKVTGSTDEKFVDQADISDWASESVEALSSKGFISGNPDGTFAPKRTLTRAEVVAMLDKITSELINKAGTYTEDVAGNLVVNTRDVILKDMTISGNLYLTEGIGDGDVTLENITVKGETFVNGGGLNSIKANGSRFLDGMKVSAKNPVRLVIIGDAVKVEAFPGTTVTLTGNFSNVILPPGVNVIIKDATVGKIFVEPGAPGTKGVANAVITIQEGSTVKDIQADAPVETKGKGKIENLVIKSEGVKTEQKPVKTEIKDKDIKADIAGKEETKQSTESSAPSTGGGGGGGNSGGGTTGPSNPSTGGGENSSDGSTTNPDDSEKVRFSGVITYKGEPVKGVRVEVVGKDNHYNDETSENGYFSFYVVSKDTYEIRASLINKDYEGFYGTKTEVATSDTEINIELTQKEVANILVTDSQGNPITDLVNLREVDASGKEVGYSHTDNRGYATIMLENKDDSPKKYNMYIDGTLVGTIDGIKYAGALVSKYTAPLDWSIGDTIEGVAVYENGEIAKNVEIELLKIVALENANWRSFRSADRTTTDDEGRYIFENFDKAHTYLIESRYEVEDNCFSSPQLNALFVSGEYNEKLVIKQSYSITIDVIDPEGVIGNQEVGIKILDSQGSSWGSNIYNRKSHRVYQNRFEPGNYKIQATVGEKVIIKDLTITKDKYNYFVKFELGNTNKKELKVKVENLSTTVGNTTIKATHVSLRTKAGSKEIIATASIDAKGNAIILLPENFEVGDMNLFVSFENSLAHWEKDITITDLNNVLVIDLEKELIRRDLSLEVAITTDSAVRFTTPVSIEFELSLGNKSSINKTVKSQSDKSNKLDFSINNIITGTYILTAKYTIGESNYKFEKVISLDEVTIWESNGPNVTEVGFEEMRSDHKISIQFK